MCVCACLCDSVRAGRGQLPSQEVSCAPRAATQRRSLAPLACSFSRVACAPRVRRGDVSGMRCCCRCYSAALWRRHGCIGPFGRMRVCCDSAATFGVGACRLANRLGALSSSCASPTCASPSLTFLALSRHVITRCTSRSRRPVCPGGDAGDARVACSPRVRRESHVRVRICNRPAPRRRRVSLLP